MMNLPPKVLLKRFESPDETREFPNGRLDLIHVGGITIARTDYRPGWRWSSDVGAASGLGSCPAEHTLVVVSGAIVTKMDDGTEFELRAGDVSYIPPGHDAWVVGTEPYVSLQFLRPA